MAKVTVGNSVAVELPLDHEALTLRYVIQNISTGNLYLGNDNTVTTTTGFKIGGNGASFVLPSAVEDGLGAVWLIADAASQDVRYFAC